MFHVEEKLSKVTCCLVKLWQERRAWKHQLLRACRVPPLALGCLICVLCIGNSGSGSFPSLFQHMGNSWEGQLGPTPPPSPITADSPLVLTEQKHPLGFHAACLSWAFCLCWGNFFHFFKTRLRRSMLVFPRCLFSQEPACMELSPQLWTQAPRSVFHWIAKWTVTPLCSWILPLEWSIFPDARPESCEPLVIG